MIHETALTVIAPRLAPIAHVQLAAAMTTAQKPRQKQFSAPYRSGDRGTFAGCVIGNHTLVPLELAPGDITPPYMVPAVYRVEHAPVPSRLLGGVGMPN